MNLPSLPDLRTREGIKTAARFLVARATSICVVTVIVQNVDTEELPAYKTASVFVGSHVIGEIVADKTKPYVDKKVDEYADQFLAAKEEAAKIQAEAAR